MKVDHRVLDFVDKHRISVLTVVLPEGVPHSSSMHYAAYPDSLDLVFFTKRDSRKCTGLVAGGKVNASVVIGFNEEEWVELQMDGDVEMVDRKNSGKDEAVFAAKFEGAKLDDDRVVLKFEPSWWRYTNFKTKPPEVLVNQG